MTTHEAKIEVLTAEVRVLMVGSRQVTLSVAKQLDEVDPEEITPFGRIRTGKRKPFAATDMIEVVGTDHGPNRANPGALVRSSLSVMLYRCGESAQRLNFNGRDCIGRRCTSYPDGDECWRGHFWADDGGDGTWQDWCKLPLIVLAGLR